MKRLILLTSLLFALVVPTQAQVSLTMDTAQGFLGLPDTVLMGSTYTVTVGYRNTGNTTLDQQLNLVMGMGVSVIDTISPVAVKFYSQNFPLAPTASDTATFNITIDSRFALGGNITVIWPMVGLDVVGDSLDGHVVVLMNQGLQFGLADAPPANRVLIHPNPANDRIFLTCADHGDKIERVRIYSLEGRLLHRDNYQSKPISLGSLPPGAYLIEIELSDGRIERQKFLRR